MEKKSYRPLTLRDLVELVQGNPMIFPRGLDTTILTGDFEGNYLHLKHEMHAEPDDDNVNALLLNYEMHENWQ